MPSPWDPFAGDYLARDGWIQLHTNAPHHRAAAFRVLGPHERPDSISRAIELWSAADLEQAIVEAGGCAAHLRTLEQWAEHPQGRAVAKEPLVHSVATAAGLTRDRPASESRPLAGLRVLDLTRVLAGPVATRFLAGYGADVLRIDPPGWNEPSVIPEVTLGKRCARLDLQDPGDRVAFERLLTTADVLIHGYRPGALDRLGFDAEVRQRLSPGIIDVSLNAYGWSGPWRERRGFDSLVQRSSGIAARGMRWKMADRPVPLPVQALDHTTGYLMAAAALRAITRRLASGEGAQIKVSLARTAKLLIDHGDGHETRPLAAETPEQQCASIESTSWGPARRLLPPASIEFAPMQWQIPAQELGLAEPRWP
jgi:crotonobetainyl-CoA:carnitine CoA-transferase CaiB-like acyl-CoA transferase